MIGYDAQAAQRAVGPLLLAAAYFASFGDATIWLCLAASADVLVHATHALFASRSGWREGRCNVVSTCDALHLCVLYGEFLWRLPSWHQHYVEGDFAFALHTLVAIARLFVMCRTFAREHRFLTEINWFMCLYVVATHFAALQGLYMASQNLMMLAEVIICYQVCGWGVTAGMHRLWSHRSYKARTPLRFFLMILASISNQGSIYHWCRDHRTHHKNSDTDADPHDSNRGFFYAHTGWLLLKKHEKVKAAGKKIPHADLLEDWVVRLNYELNPLWDQFLCFGMPTLYGLWRYNSLAAGFFVFGALRWILLLQATWCVNSVAHWFGDRPYTDIKPTESLLTTIVACGEGWHNWHHSYPYDYAASELGFSEAWNPTKLFIDAMAVVGQSYDRKRKTLDSAKSDY